MRESEWNFLKEKYQIKGNLENAHTNSHNNEGEMKDENEIENWLPTKTNQRQRFKASILLMNFYLFDKHPLDVHFRELRIAEKKKRKF